VIHDGTVPAPDAPSAGGRVVVGVGGSPAAATVLRVAAEAAAEMEAELVALAAWEDTTAFGDPELDVRAELEGAARRELEGAVDEVFGDARPPRLRAVLREGPAARVLVEESADADLVVVGRSGRSEFAGVLLGSIALPVAEHAASPVLVVPVVPQDAGHRHVPDGLAAARV
jgi:nucleotide-binding universal stress UspA family protein